MNHSHKLMIAAIASVALIGAGCAKKVAVRAPQPAPAPAAAVSTPAPAPAPVRAAAAAPAQASRYPSAATRARIDQLLARIEDAYFDYDATTIRPDAVKALQTDSAALRDILAQYPDYKLTIQGHCDERGSAEYNLALGDKRAEAAKDFLVTAGIPAAQLNLISYGKERPVCAEHDEDCWQKNRHVHIVAQAQNQQP